MRKSLLSVTVLLFFSTLYAQTASNAMVGEATAASVSEQKPVYTAEQQRLRVTASDIRLVPETELPTKGYHLYVRKRPGIESIMLTETTKDPAGKNDNYAYRATEYNPINGDEIRYLDGKPLVSESAKYSLVDSTPEPYAAFGEAFHIYIPEKMVYGYEWSRNGEVQIGQGTFINIRTFEKQFADYSGNFMDSPFMFDLQPRKKKVAKQKVEEPIPEPITILTDDYNPVASDKFQEIAERMIYSKGPESIITDILGYLDDIDGTKNADVVFAIDATGSMKDDIDKLKTELVPSLLEKFKGSRKVRIGLLFYRDYGDNFNYKNLPVKLYDFTNDFDEFNKNLNSLKINGKEGGDIPEAVYEALYASVEFYKWDSKAVRKVILIGDAEPHPSPRGTRKYSKEFVSKTVKENNVWIDAILLPSK